MDKSKQSIDALLTYAEQLGRWPKTSEWNRHAKENQLNQYPYICRKLKMNWKQAKISFGYDKTTERIIESEKALFIYANKIGYWPSTMEWNKYARENGHYTYTQLHVKTHVAWKTLQKRAGF